MKFYTQFMHIPCRKDEVSYLQHFVVTSNNKIVDLCLVEEVIYSDQYISPTICC